MELTKQSRGPATNTRTGTSATDEFCIQDTGSVRRGKVIAVGLVAFSSYYCGFCVQLKNGGFFCCRYEHIFVMDIFSKFLGRYNGSNIWSIGICSCFHCSFLYVVMYA